MKYHYTGNREDPGQSTFPARPLRKLSPLWRRGHWEEKRWASLVIYSRMSIIPDCWIGKNAVASMNLTYIMMYKSKQCKSLNSLDSITGSLWKRQKGRCKKSISRYWRLGLSWLQKDTGGEFVVQWDQSIYWLLLWLQSTC